MMRGTRALCLGLIALVFPFFGNTFVRADTIYTSLWSGEIKRVDSNGNVSAFANRGQFWYGPYGLAFGPDNYLYVAETYRGAIVKLDSAGHESSFASGLSTPLALAFDGSGNLYVANADVTIWKFDPSGNRSFFASGVGASGLLVSLAFDRSGNLYELTSGGTIGKYDSSGNGTVFASGLSNPVGLAIDNSGRLLCRKRQSQRRHNSAVRF